MKVNAMHKIIEKRVEKNNARESNMSNVLCNLSTFFDLTKEKCK